MLALAFGEFAASPAAGGGQGHHKEAWVGHIVEGGGHARCSHNVRGHYSGRDRDGQVGHIGNRNYSGKREGAVYAPTLLLRWYFNPCCRQRSHELIQTRLNP